MFIINHDFTEGRKFLMPLVVMHPYTTVEVSIELCADDWIDSTRGFPKTVETLEQMIILHLVMAQNIFCCVPVALQCTGVNSW